MQPVASFFENNLTIIYFFYGLAFFCMGLLVWIESGRASTFRLARAMGPLAGFGLVHGLHEWFEMFQGLGAAGAANIPAWLLRDEVRIAHLALSFSLLVVFGIRLIYLSREEASRTENSLPEKMFAYLAAGALLGVWLISLLLTYWVYHPAAEEFILAADALSRYILAIPGAVLAAWAIVLEQRTFRRLNMPDTGQDLQRAALALFIYGVFGQIFPRASFLFPANVVNATLFSQLFGIPIQLFRAVMAALVALFIVRALRAFEVERQQNLARANEARLAAQSEALAIQAKSRRETEQLNRELQTAVHELTLLFDLSRSLSATLNRDALLNQAMNQICDSLPYIQTALVILRTHPDQPLRCFTHAGYDKLPTPGTPQCDVGQQLVAYTLQTGRPALLADGLIEPILPGHGVALALGSSAYIGIPLGESEALAGGLVLGIQPDMSALNQRDVALLETVGGQLSIAIENATRYGEAQARETLRGELLHQVVSAQESERQRIARELHDGTGQALTALGLGLAAASENMRHNPAVAVAQLTELKTMSTQALQELRDLIVDLRPSLLDDLGLVPALQSQVQSFTQRTGVQADFVLNGRRQRVQPEIETIVYRIAQEALTNVTKHAQASRVTVQIGFDEHELRLEVRDDGRGFDAANGRRQVWGLLGMQERVALVGGSCVVQSQPGQGTAVQVTIPI